MKDKHVRGRNTNEYEGSYADNAAVFHVSNLNGLRAPPAGIIPYLVSRPVSGYRDLVNLTQEVDYIGVPVLIVYIISVLRMESVLDKRGSVSEVTKPVYLSPSLQKRTS